MIELWYNNEEYATAEYSGFQIGDSSSFYPLSFASFVGGNAGNGLEHHNGMMFTTYDSDHDNSSNSCGEYYSCGWWFNDCFVFLFIALLDFYLLLYCIILFLQFTNLNGDYDSADSEFGIHFTTWKTMAESMSQVIMKIQ